MLFSKLVTVAGLLRSASAAALAACTTDACLEQVNSNRAAPTSIAKTGCTSFFLTTVTPEPSTHTVTSKTTVVEPSTITEQVTAHITKRPTVDVTSTVATVTVTNPSTTVEEVDETTTEQDTVTVMSTNVHTTDVPTTTVTVLETETPGANMMRREPSAAAIKAAVCPAGSTKTNTVPAYVTACAGPTAYSSACSCAGVTQATTTLPACTTTTTVVDTVTSFKKTTVTSHHTTYATEPTTVVSSATLTITETPVVTSYSTSEFTVTSSTTIIDSISADTTVKYAASTTIGVDVARPTFSISTSSDGSNPLYVAPIQDGTALQVGDTSLFYLDAQGHLILTDNGYIANRNADINDAGTVFWNSQATINLLGLVELVCTITPEDSPSDAILSCSGHGSTTFSLCGTPALLLTPPNFPGCPPVTLYAA